jgi:hypothetical protein
MIGNPKTIEVAAVFGFCESFEYGRRTGILSLQKKLIALWANEFAPNRRNTRMRFI